MKRRLPIIFGAVILALGLLVAGAGAWLLRTEGGAAWLLDALVKRSGGVVAIGAANGDLYRGLVLRQLELELPAARLRLAELRFSVRLAGDGLRIEPLRARGLDVTFIPAPVDDGGTLLGPQQLRLPLALHLRDATLEELRWRSGQEAFSVLADRLELSLDWGETIRVQRLRAEAPRFTAELGAELALDHALAHRLQLVLRADPASGAAPELAEWFEQLEFTLAGNADRTAVEVLAGPGDARISGDITQPFADPRAALRWSLGRRALDEPALVLEGFAGDLGGTPDDYALTGSGRVLPPDGPAMELRFSGAGGLDQLELSQLELTAGDFAASGVAALTWADALRAALELEFGGLSLAHWIDGWPADLSSGGELSLAWSPGVLDLERLLLEPGMPGARIAAHGRLDLEAGTAEAALGWEALSWPPGQGGETLRSQTGSVTVSGVVDDWRLEGALELEAAGYPGGRFRLEGGGDRHSAALRMVEGAALGGEWRGEGSLSWDGPLALAAALSAQSVDSSALLPGLPARVTADLRVRHDGASRRTRLVIERLEGEHAAGRHAGEALSAEGAIVFGPESWPSFEGLRLRSGASALAIDGAVASAPGVNVDLDVVQGGWLAERLGGAYRGELSLAVADGLPRIRADLEGRSLAVGDFRARWLSVTNAGPDTLELRLRSAELAGRELDKARLQLSAPGGDWRLAVELHRQGLVAQGALRGPRTPLATLRRDGWAGTLERLDIGLDDDRLLGLTGPATVQFAAERVTVGSACLAADGARVTCLDSFEWTPEGLVLTARLTELPLQLSELLWPHGLQMSQTLSGAVRWQSGPGRAPSGEVALELSAGVIRNPLGGDALETEAGYFGFRLADGALSDGQADFVLADIGFVDIDFSTAPGADGALGPLSGRARLEIDDLEPVGWFLPSVAVQRGRLTAEGDITGQVTDPVIRGRFDISDLGFELPLLGLRAWSGDFRGLMERGDRLSLDGSMRVGDGEAQVKADFGWSDPSAPSARLSVTGENLRLIDLPDLQASVDPDVRLGWKPGEVTVNGSMTVPTLVLTPVTTFVRSIDQSPDVVVVAGQLPTTEPPKSAPVAVVGELAVTLGDEVRLDADLARVRATGTLRLNWNGPVMPSAEGELRTDGTLTAYGPRLHIDGGLISFNGGPVDAPALDIRAERDIYGNTQISAAGVRVTGTPRRPLVEAYTTPFTNEERAWTLLITGSDIQYGQGIGGFDIGAYIAPRIYLSYGVSLFNKENVVGIRYDLRKGFGIKATSGERSSGIDASWTRDH